MRKILLLSLIIIGLMMSSVNAQVGIGTDSPKSALDVASTTSGILIPRLTATQILAIDKIADHNGMLVYATDTSGAITSTGFWYYDSATSGWKTMSTGSGGGGATQTVIYAETSGTEITVSEATEQQILTETITLSAVSTVDVEGVLNVKSSNQSIVPELRLEIKDATDAVVFTKTVRKGMLTTPTVQLQDDLGIYGIKENLGSGTYTVSLYASQPSCCNVSGLSFVTGGSDTLSFMKITY
ncbi:hypothetical protein UJ101_01900 [Flavobacteriaceae bacterium UJ101]|nr:hypothetical protein UJ101_01900 [Flavobacteriaceae bacterium UJ101]